MCAAANSAAVDVERIVAAYDIGGKMC